MLASLQRVITLGIVSFGTAWAIACIAAGMIGWAGAGFAAIVVGYALFLGVEFVCLRIVNRGDPAPRATLPQLVRAWLGEVLMGPRVFCWRQPFRSNALPDVVEAGAGAGGRGLVLVHGFVCNRGFWNPWLRRLRALGIPHVAVNLEPPFGSIDGYGEIIEAAVRRLQAATGQPPLVVAHSMGGLAVRAWLAGRASNRSIVDVVTIGTPHHGTWLARFSFSRNGAEMRHGSAWYASLTAREAARGNARFTCFYGHCDNIVFPTTTATLPGAENRHVEGSAHVALAFRAEVVDYVMRALGKPGARD